jgi:hypothetical protein
MQQVNTTLNTSDAASPVREVRGLVIAMGMNSSGLRAKQSPVISIAFLIAFLREDFHFRRTL